MSSARAELPRATGLRRFVRGMSGRAYPRVIGSTRDLSWMFYDTVLPLLGTAAFVFVYKALGAGDRFTGYVIMGGAATAFWLNIMWAMAAQFWWDKQGGNLELYLIAPCGLPAILLGMSVGGFIATMLRAVLVVGIGSVAFGVTYTLTQPVVFVLVFAVTVVALYGLGVTLASVFLMWGREAWHMSNLFSEPVYLLSGFFFPVKALGLATGLVASILPMTLALDAMRQLMFPDTHPALLGAWTELGILAGLAVVFFLTARVSLRVFERMARREARLSLRY